MFPRKRKKYLFNHLYASDVQLKINLSSSNDDYSFNKNNFLIYTDNIISRKFIRVKSHVWVSKSGQKKLIWYKICH